MVRMGRRADGMALVSAAAALAGAVLASGAGGRNSPAAFAPIWRAISKRVVSWPGPFQAAAASG